MTIDQYMDGTATLVRVNGSQVIVALPSGLSIPEQGRRLLALEKRLRAEVNSDIQVFLEPMQDRNAIRQFRGVTVE